MELLFFSFQEYWYVVLLGFLAAVTVFLACVKCFTVHTKSNNPNLELKHPHRTVRQSVRTVSRSMSHAGGTFQRQMSSFRTSFTKRGTRNSAAEKKDMKDEQELECLNSPPQQQPTATQLSPIGFEGV